MRLTVRGRIALAMSTLVIVNTVGVLYGWWAYGRAARYGEDAKAASHRAAVANMAAGRVSVWSADAGRLAIAALRATRPEELSETYGAVLGSEQAATLALAQVSTVFGSEGAGIDRRWERLRDLTYRWVNAEAADGGTTLRMRRTNDGTYRASVASNLETGTAPSARSAAQLRDESRAETALLSDASLRTIVSAASDDALVAAASEERARAVARNGMVLIAWVELALAVLVGVVLFRGIARPLESARRFAARVAEGDWSATFDDHAHDEIGMLTHTVEDMKNALAQKVTLMREMAGAVLVTAEEMDASARDVARIASADGNVPPALAGDIESIVTRARIITGLAGQMLE